MALTPEAQRTIEQLQAVIADSTEDALALRARASKAVDRLAFRRAAEATEVLVRASAEAAIHLATVEQLKADAAALVVVAEATEPAARL